MAHTVRDYLVFVRQGMPKVEPLRLLSLAEGEVEVQLYSLTDAALARMALDNLDEVPEDASTVAVMEDQDHPAREAYAPHLAFDPPERVEGGWQVQLRHPPVASLTEVVVRDLRGRDIRYAASLGLDYDEEFRVASVGARAGLDYESVQKLAFVDYLACSNAGGFLGSDTPNG